MIAEFVCYSLGLDSTQTRKSIGYNAADHAANSTANTCHHTQANSHIGELSGSFVSCCILRHIKSAFLLIGVAFLHTLSRLCLRVNNNLLRFSLRMNHIGLLTKFCFCNISVLTEMQFLEFFILRIAVRFDDCGNIETF